MPCSGASQADNAQVSQAGDDFPLSQADAMALNVKVWIRCGGWPVTLWHGGCPRTLFNGSGLGSNCLLEPFVEKLVVGQPGCPGRTTSFFLKDRTFKTRVSARSFKKILVVRSSGASDPLKENSSFPIL